MIKKKHPDWTARYPGLSFNGKLISDYFPASKIYVEPFSGLARTAKYARAPRVILNDMSEYANRICKKKYPSAEITHQDFADCIKRWDGPDTFFLIDPPWQLDYYIGGKPQDHLVESLELLRNKRRKATELKTKHKRLTMFFGGDSSKNTPAFIDRTVKEYLTGLMKILDKTQAHYIVTLSPKNKFYAPFMKEVRNPRQMLFGGHPTNSLYSNKPLKIRIPQLTKYF